MFFVGMHRGAELHPFDYQAFVEAVGESLKYDAVFRDAAHELPESRRAATHNSFIVMMIRPDSVFGAIQNIAPHDVETEPQNEIQIVFFDFLNVGLGKVRGNTFYYWFTTDYGRFFWKYKFRDGLAFWLEKVSVPESEYDSPIRIMSDFFKKWNPFRLAVIVHDDKRKLDSVVNQQLNGFSLPSLYVKTVNHHPESYLIVKYFHFFENAKVGKIL